MLRGPRLLNDGRRGTALSLLERAAEKGVMAIVPGGFDEHAADVRIAGFRDRAPGLLRATRVFRGDKPGEAHETGRRRKAARIAEFGSEGQRSEIVEAAEAAQALDAGAQGLDGQQIAQLGVDGLEPSDGFVHGTDVGPVGLLERGQRPALGLEPRGMAFCPRLLGRGKAAPVAQEKFRQTVPRAEEIGANVFATAQEIARGFFLLGGDVNRGERAGPIEGGELGRIAAIGFDAVARPARNQGGRDDVTRHAVRGERAL